VHKKKCSNSKVRGKNELHWQTAITSIWEGHVTHFQEQYSLPTPKYWVHKKEPGADLAFYLLTLHRSCCICKGWADLAFYLLTLHRSWCTCPEPLQHPQAKEELQPPWNPLMRTLLHW
jgi:hypothetical protein